LETSSGAMACNRPFGVMAERLRAAAARKSPQDALDAVIDMAVQTGPCEAASVTMLGPGGTTDTVAASDERIVKADRLQYELQEGPCLDAVWDDGMFVIPDLVADGRWPRWSDRAAGLGVGSSVSVHLFTDTALGSLNMYSMHPRRYEHADLEAAKVIAAHVSVVVAFARTEQNLWQAIDSRNLIGQAQGMLMQKYGLTADKAFAVLRRYSQVNNVKIAVLAEEITTTGLLSWLGTHAGFAVPVDDAPFAG
jgi:GAF domain-containing protein